jgi:hypothetical protein
MRIMHAGGVKAPVLAFVSQGQVTQMVTWQRHARMCRFHLQHNANRAIEEDLHEPASLKNPGEAGYVAPPGNPQGYLKNDPAAVNKGSGVSGAAARSAHAAPLQRGLRIFFCPMACSDIGTCWKACCEQGHTPDPSSLWRNETGCAWAVP